MSFDFKNYQNITKVVIPNRVNLFNSDFSYAFQSLNNLTNVVLPNGTTNLRGSFLGCSNLTKAPNCPDNVTSLEATFKYCYNLIGNPVCGSGVINMSNAYNACYNLNGTPVCGLNVTNMSEAYTNCYSLTGSPVCGDKVTNMFYTYENCYNLTGAPVCGNQVQNMCSAYQNCSNLIGPPACGQKVTDMHAAYANCTNLTGSPVAGEKVLNVHSTYKNCPNLYGNAFFYSPNILSVQDCFNGRNTANRLNLYIPINSQTQQSITSGGSYTYITGYNYFSNRMQTNNCYVVTDSNLYIYPVSNVKMAYMACQTEDGVYIEEVKEFKIPPNSSVTYNIPYISVGETRFLTSFDVTPASNPSVAGVGSMGNHEPGVLSMTLYSGAAYASSTATLTLGFGNVVKTLPITIAVIENDYTVSNITDAEFGFSLNSNGYYESDNKGVDSSYAICKLDIMTDGKKQLILDCINQGEDSCDYGAIYYPNLTPSFDNYIDSEQTLHSFYSSSSSEVQSINCGALSAGSHYIYIKYRKDGSVSNGNNSLQFKVRFE